LRRGELASVGEVDEPTLERGSLRLNLVRHECTWKDQRVDLTATEFLVLQCLVERPGHVKNRRQLMDAAYGPNIYVDDRTVDSHVKRVRKKFIAADSSFAHIETLYGVGYRFKPETPRN
jgi:two-component system, OmpR family, response regulator ChvI